MPDKRPTLGASSYHAGQPRSPESGFEQGDGAASRHSVPVDRRLKWSCGGALHPSTRSCDDHFLVGRQLVMNGLEGCGEHLLILIRRTRHYLNKAGPCGASLVRKTVPTAVVHCVPFRAFANLGQPARISGLLEDCIGLSRITIDGNGPGLATSPLEDATFCSAALLVVEGGRRSTS